MNWFIALPVAADGWFPERLATPPPGTKLLHPEDLHLTVIFLGSCGEEKALAAWRAIVWPLGRVETRLGPVVPLGPPKRFSALSATCLEHRERIEASMDVARHAAANAAGVAVDPRPPLAHVTVARPKRSATNHDRKAALSWASALDLGKPSVGLGSIALYTWSETEERSKPGGRSYRQVELRPV